MRPFLSWNGLTSGVYPAFPKFELHQFTFMLLVLVFSKWKKSKEELLSRETCKAFTILHESKVA